MTKTNKKTNGLPKHLKKVIVNHEAKLKAFGLKEIATLVDTDKANDFHPIHGLVG